MAHAHAHRHIHIPTPIHIPNLKPVLDFFRKNTVMTVALVAAMITSIAVPIDRQYIEYFDFKTLTCLFCVLAVVCALKNINFFYMLAKKLIQIFRFASTFKGIRNSNCQCLHSVLIHEGGFIQCGFHICD